jgi:photosystem II stability/assembly factor-like uncharacterized protein
MVNSRWTPPADVLDRASWRCIGPFRAGRVVAVAGHPTERNVFYFGSTGGGVWRTDDAGVYWKNVSDGFFKRASVGAIAIAAAAPNVIYVGMGETCIRGNVSHGDGVYRSDDGGETWRHLGLAETRHIAKIRVDPFDPDIVYVAAFGHAHGPNPERGIYRSRDGGRSWTRILYRNPKTGAADLSIDPSDRRTLYATLWEGARRPWEIVSGGSGSGIFRSRDAGETWTEITRAPGLPDGVLGKIGISASPKSGRVFAIVEAKDGGVFRSEDGGETWGRGSTAPALRERAWYYEHIYAHPSDPDTAWVLNKSVWISRDAGATFEALSMPHKDHHDVWIDPRDPDRILEGNDAGTIVSLNGGRSWSSMFNQPTAEIYHVAVDDAFPYRVYGAQQDNTTIALPSRTATGAITMAQAFEVGGGESGYISVKPHDADVVYATNHLGTLTRMDRRTGQTQNVGVWPVASRGAAAKSLKYRFNWTTPVLVSRHAPHAVYVGANRLFRSLDEGRSWRAISPDLTRDDETKQGDSGGPITVDNGGVDHYCTISVIAESPRSADTLWVGSDDGLVHVSRSGGKRWTNVTPPAVKPFAFVTSIEPSRHDDATAYVTLTRYKLDDFAPYIFRTRDGGRTWRSIRNGIPKDEFVRVVREDPENPRLVFAGTEAGAYVSFDSGGQWHRLGGALPYVPVHDLVIAGSDLVAATHGRSFWILDDLSVLRQVAAAKLSSAHLFAPRSAYRLRVEADTAHLHRRGHDSGDKKQRRFAQEGALMVAYEGPRPIDAGTNAPEGATVWFWLPKLPKSAGLSILDSRGSVVRTLEPHLRAGLNKSTWDMRYRPAAAVSGGFDVALVGPRAVPGTYRVRLEADGAKLEQDLVIERDPRASATDRDLGEQFKLHLRIRDKLSEVNDAINDIRVAREAGKISARLTSLEGKLMQLKAKSHGEMASYPPMLNNQLSNLAVIVDAAEVAPSESMHEASAFLAERADKLVAEVRTLLPRRSPRARRSRGGNGGQHRDAGRAAALS